MPVEAQVVSPLCFWPTSYKSQVPMTHSSSLINLPEWLMEFRETFYLVDSQLIAKGYNSRTARWKTCTGPGMGKSEAIPCSLWGYRSPWRSMCSPARKLFEPFFFCIFLRKHHYIRMIKWLAIGKWYNFHFLSPPWRSGGELKVSTL